MTTGLKSRELSFQIIRKVLDQGATLEGAIVSCSNNISSEERAFIKQLTTTTIRRLGQLDKIINHYSKKKFGNTQMAIRHVMRLGICQLLFMEVPAYAAVDTSIKLIDQCVPKKLHYLRNMVNAVLRKVDQERELLVKKFSNTRLNIPRWLLESWDERYGQGTVKDIIAQILCEAPLDISLKPNEDADTWASLLGGVVMADGGIRVRKAGRIPSLCGYEDGKWWIQDMGARIPASLLDAKSGDAVLDLCAAPGGKAIQSATTGALVTAVDISESRLTKLRQNMERLNLRLDVITSDVLDYQTDNKWDFILLDAPCSSTGTIRRHPEILHTRKKDDVLKLAELQTKMLDHASSLLSKGGVLVYCVCSMEKEEGPDQINALLERDGSLKRREVSINDLPYLEQAILPSGDVQTLPHYMEDGIDGFFISRLIKT